MTPSLPPLFAAAAAGAQIVTANKRLARYLSEQYDRNRMHAGAAVWVRPAILPYSVWLAKMLAQLGLDGPLLTQEQEQFLWERAISEDLERSGHALLNVSATARRASEAQRLLCQFRCDFGPDAANDDQRAFLRWRIAYRRQLAAGGWHDGSQTPELVASRAGQLALPRRVLFAGFDTLTPELLELHQALRCAGAEVELWSLGVASGTVRRCAGLDPQDEVRSCARWARAILQDDPAATIGVVAPQLERYRASIETIFRAELDPAAAIAGDAAEAFSLSLGRSLAAEGVIRAALKLLELKPRVSCDEISWLLRSPYCAGAESETSVRALADADLRGRGQRFWMLTRLIRTFAAGGKLPLFVALLRDLERFGTRLRREHAPSFWAEAFADLLESLGWPGERSLSSREFQAAHRFKGTLSELVALDRVTASMSASAALAFVRRRAAETIFQPEGVEGPIEILGVLEASGQHFDHLWVLGLHESALPQPARPQPFIPLTVQRQLGMPHADAARELRYAREVFTRVCASATQVVCSWPLQEAGVALRPSPLLAAFPDSRPQLAASAAPTTHLFLNRPLLEQREDSRAPALAPGRTVSGGTNLIKDQALCPFRAFAHHRLRAEGLDSPDLGLDPMARGTLIHTVMEHFWRQTQTQAALLQLTPQAEMVRLQAAAAEAIEHYERRERVSLPATTRRLEMARLSALGSLWLTAERKRPPFALAACEESHQVPLGRLTIRTKVDRIDRLDDGRLAIIDYKTGQVDPSQWLDERLTEPQLPIYCRLLQGDQIGAVLFARIRPKAQDCSFRGLVRDLAGWPATLQRAQTQLLAQISAEDFDAVLRRWEATLSALADAFVAGVASVDPVDPRKTCSSCDLMPLCRIHDLHPEAGKGGDDE